MLFRIKLVLVCFAAGMGASQLTWADMMPLEQSSSVTLSSLTQGVYQRHPARQNERAQQQQINANTELANATFADVSTVSLNHQNDIIGSNGGLQEWGGSVAMPLWLPGQKQQQLVLSDKMAAELPAYQQNIKLNASAQVRTLIWNVVQASTATKQAYQDWQTAKKLELDVALRVKAGDMAGSERLLVMTNTLDMQTQYLLKNSELDYALSHYRAITRQQALPKTYDEMLSTKTDIDQQHPSLMLLEQQINTLRTKQELAKFDGAVNPNVSFGVRHDRGGVQGDQFNTSVGLGISFALDDKVYRRPALANAAKALADVEVARQQLERELNITLFSHLHDLKTKQLQLKIVSEQAITTQQYLVLQQRAFDLGEIDLVSLLRSQALASQSHYQKRALEVEVKRAIAMVNQALGVIL